METARQLQNLPPLPPDILAHVIIKSVPKTSTELISQAAFVVDDREEVFPKNGWDDISGQLVSGKPYPMRVRPCLLHIMDLIFAVVQDFEGFDAEEQVQLVVKRTLELMRQLRDEEGFKGM